MSNNCFWIILESVGKALRADRSPFAYHCLTTAADFVVLWLLGYQLGDLLPCCLVASDKCFGWLRVREANPEVV